MTPDLNDPAVRDALKQAWLDSQPGTAGGSEYSGELVISAEVIYHITPAGRMREVGATREILSAEEGV